VSGSPLSIELATARRVTPSSAHTVGGYVFEHLDRLPQVGDSILLGNYLLRVEELDQRRIARLRVERKGEAGGTSPAS